MIPSVGLGRHDTFFFRNALHNSHTAEPSERHVPVTSKGILKSDRDPGYTVDEFGQRELAALATMYLLLTVTFFTVGHQMRVSCPNDDVFSEY